MKNRRTLQEKKAEVINYLTTCYGIKTIACRKAKVGRTQFYEWKKEDPEFALKVSEIEESFLDFVETLLMELIKLNDRAAIMFFLKAKGRSRGYR